LFRSTPIVFQIIGSSLKLLPTAAWDEIHIFLTSIQKVKWPIDIPLQLLIIWQIYMILLAMLNGYGNSLTFFRFVLVFFSLFLLKNYYRRLIRKVSKNNFLVVGYMYLLICIFLYALGEYLNLPVAWWQEWLWAGTAYSAYVIYIIVALVFLIKNNIKYRVIFITTGYAAGLLMDSRLVMILLTTLLPFIFFGLAGIRHRLSIKKIFNGALVALIFSFSLYFIISNNLETVRKGLLQPYVTIQDLVVENDASDRDADRQENLLSIVSLFNKNPLNFFIGTGLTSHQYELAGFMNKSEDGRVRPTGVPAMLFDGGFIYIFIILMCALSSSLKAANLGLNRLISPWASCLWISIIMNSLVVTLVTNTTDLMLWWAVLLSGLIINKDFLIKYKEE